METLILKCTTKMQENQNNILKAKLYLIFKQIAGDSAFISKIILWYINISVCAHCIYSVEGES